MLWTRRPFETGTESRLLVEVAEDEAFKHVVASAPAVVCAASDWTCRVLAGNRPRRRVILLAPVREREGDVGVGVALPFCFARLDLQHGAAHASYDHEVRNVLLAPALRKMTGSK